MHRCVDYPRRVVCFSTLCRTRSVRSTILPITIGSRMFIYNGKNGLYSCCCSFAREETGSTLSHGRDDLPELDSRLRLAEPFDGESRICVSANRSQIRSCTVLFNTARLGPVLDNLSASISMKLGLLSRKPIGNNKNCLMSQRGHCMSCPKRRFLFVAPITKFAQV